jgi:hypothetical protein
MIERSLIDSSSWSKTPCSRPLAGIIEPCLPLPAARPPIGGDWLHEIKHDGFRIMARRDAAGVRFLIRNGHDFAGRFPLAAAAVAALPARSCLIDGEAIVTDQNGLAVFDLIHGNWPSHAAVLCAFHLLELDGEDLRREPIETRKSTLKSLLRGKHAGIAFNAHFTADGTIVYRQACALLLGLARDCGRRRVLDLHPTVGASRAVRRAEALRHDTLTAELASFGRNWKRCCGREFTLNGKTGTALALTPPPGQEPSRSCR